MKKKLHISGFKRSTQGRNPHTGISSVVDPDPFDPDPAFHFDTDPDPAAQFDTDPDLYRFKEVPSKRVISSPIPNNSIFIS
jgi:hypothetical protein